ncbi:MAG TPA: M12 family metallopeptidase [Thiolinea sp.]|nr:M12 family metallopeptidase [Thiolinea sp.]
MNDPDTPKRFCCLPVQCMREPELKALEELDPERSFAILEIHQKWVDGSTLTYYFFDADTDKSKQEDANGQVKQVSWRGKEHQKEQIRQAFKAWKDLGINLDFKEVSDRRNAIIRVGFMEGDGSWSYVGTDCKTIKDSNQRTMNIGWDQANDFTTYLHEVGHALGLTHEHQSAKAGIVWNTQAVYKYFRGDPNYWEDAYIKSNILDKVHPDQVQASAWDPDSCMHYDFNAGLIDQPEKYRSQPLRPKGGLSARDKEWVKTFYPPPDEDHTRRLAASNVLKVMQPLKLNLSQGQQLNYPISIDETREYNIQRSGESDAVMVLFENTASGWKQIKAVDDSGQAGNALLQATLDKDKEYNLRVRLYWEGKTGATIITLW